MKSDIDRLVYSPNSAYRNQFVSNQCAASVADGGRSVDHHQCGSVASVTVGGYKWCKRHAIEARRAIGEKISTETVYIVGRHSLGVYIERVNVISRTDKSITAENVKSIFGVGAHSRGVIKLDGVSVGTLDECKEKAAAALRKEADNMRRRASEVYNRADEVERITAEQSAEDGQR
jgi:hypothetical protein